MNKNSFFLPASIFKNLRFVRHCLILFALVLFFTFDHFVNDLQMGGFSLLTLQCVMMLEWEGGYRRAFCPLGVVYGLKQKRNLLSRPISNFLVASTFEFSVADDISNVLSSLFLPVVILKLNYLKNQHVFVQGCLLQTVSVGFFCVFCASL